MTEWDRLLQSRPFLTVVGGGLAIDGVRAQEIVAAYGTPVSVVSRGRLFENLASWRTALTAAWPFGPTLVMPSFKALPSRPVWRHLATTEVGCDVFGEHELRAALDSGIDPTTISLNGTAKTPTAIQLAVEAGARITLDSLDEMRRTAAIASTVGRRTAVRLRLRPWLPSTTTASDFTPDVAAHVAVHDYRAGMPETDVDECIDVAAGSGWVDIVGIHAHLSRQTTDLAFWGAFGDWMAEAVARVDDQLTEHAQRVREVSFGGGFATPADPTGQAQRRRHAAVPTPADYLSTVLGAFATRLTERRSVRDGLAVHIEPGRAVFADAGIHLTSVTHVKAQSRPVERVFVETDTSEAFLPDVIWEASRFEVLPISRPSSDRPPRLATVTGTSCGFDVLRGPEPMTVPSIGDVVAFLDTGAYQDALANNFNLLGRPPLILVDDGSHTLVRRRETYVDVVQRDVDTNPSLVTALDHVSLRVTNIDASLEWYHDLLGIPLRDRGVLGGGADELVGCRAEYADLDLGAGQTLELLRLPTGEPNEPADRPWPGRAHVSLRTNDATDIHRRVAAAGFGVSGPPVAVSESGFWQGSTVFYARDPDGHTIEFIHRPSA